MFLKIIAITCSMLMVIFFAMAAKDTYDRRVKIPCIILTVCYIFVTVVNILV